MAVANGVDIVDRPTETQARNAGNAAAMSANRQLNHIPGYQLQNLRDHMAGMYDASMNMGRSGENFLNDVSGVSFLNQMEVRGLGPEQAGKLASLGAANLGSRFNKNQILEAKRFENIGLGSAETNMQRMALLAGGSTQNPSKDLEQL